MDDVASLEEAISQFYNPETPHDKRAAIEEQLRGFKARGDAWRIAANVISDVTNPYSLWFLTSVIEEFVRNGGYEALPPGSSDRSGLRGLVESLCMESGSQKAFVRTKLGKVLVDIGKRDWPRIWPAFLEHVVNYARQTVHSVLQDGGGSGREPSLFGLQLLKILCEEVTSQKDDIPIARREEVKGLFISHLPEIFEVLDCLFNASVPVLNENLTTGGASLGDAVIMAVELASEVIAWAPVGEIEVTPVMSALCNLSSSMIFAAIQLRNAERVEGVCFSQDDDRISTCLSSSLSAVWECLHRPAVPRDVESFLILLHAQLPKLLEGLNALLQTPTSTESYEEVFRKLIDILIVFFQRYGRRVEASSVIDLSSVVTPLVILTSNVKTAGHLQEVIRVWDEFLGVFTGPDGSPDQGGFTAAKKYMDSLGSVLSLVLERSLFSKNAVMLSDLSREPGSGDDIYSSHMEAAAATPSSYGMSGREEGGSSAAIVAPSELDVFLAGSIDLLRRGAAIYPDEVFQLVLPVLGSHAEKYKADAAEASASEGSPIGSFSTVNKTADNVSLDTLITLRDTETLVRLFGALAAEVFVVDFEQRFTFSLSLVSAILDISDVGAYAGLFIGFAKETETSPWAKVHAEVVGSLRCLMYWMGSFLEAVRRGGGTPESGMTSNAFSSCLARVLKAIRGCFLGNDGNLLYPQSDISTDNSTSGNSIGRSLSYVQAAAAALLRSLAITVRPEGLANHADVSALLLCSNQLFFSSKKLADIAASCSITKKGSYATCEGGACLELWRGLVCAIFMTSTSQDECQEKAGFLLGMAMQGLQTYASRGDIFERTVYTSAEVAKEIAALCALLLAAVESVAGEIKSVKQILLTTMEPVLPVILQVLHLYASDVPQQAVHSSHDETSANARCVSVVRETLRMFSIFGQAYKKMLPRDAYEGILKVVLNLLAEKAAISIWMDCFELLRSVIREPVFVEVVEDCMTVCFGQVANFLTSGEAESMTSDLAKGLFELLFAVVLEHWKVLVGTQPGGSIHALLQRLMGLVTDVLLRGGIVDGSVDKDLVRYILERLTMLNEKKLLFSRDWFTSLLSAETQAALLNILLDKTFDAVREEILAVLYSVAVSGFGTFYNTVVPTIVRRKGEMLSEEEKVLPLLSMVSCLPLMYYLQGTLLNQIGHSTDAPTFNRALTNFANDYFYFKTMNESRQNATLL